MTHTSLLERYATHCDAEAFARIVEEYQRFVFATCRRRLHNVADIDDAVQETFLRLAKNARNLRSNLGGWLHRCAINVSTDLNRRRSTRRQHESFAAASRSESSSALQQELVELREHLDAALQRIGEGHRELIIQRYFVGRQQVDIAADEGVAPSTITHRLEAALNALRGELEAMGTHSFAGAAAANVLARAIESEGASASVSQTLSANLMRIGLSGASQGASSSALGIKIAIGLAAAVAMIVAGALQLSRSPNSPPATQPIAIAPSAPTSATANAPTSSTAFTVRDNGNRDAAVPPNWTPTSQPSTMPAGVLAGRITDSAGRPASSGTVELVGAGRAATAISSDGFYSIPAVGRDGEYRIGVHADGFMSIEPYISTLPNIQLTTTSHERRDIVLERGALVEVTVLDLNQKPIVGSVVNLSQPDARDNALRSVATNTEGVAKFTVKAGQSFTAAVWAKGYAPANAAVVTESWEKPIKLTIQPELGFQVIGIAICADGKPAAGWTMYALPDWWIAGSYPKAATIDADGNFTLKDIGPGKYRLSLSIPMGGDMSSMASAGSMEMPPTSQPIRPEIDVVSPASRYRVAGQVKFSDGGGSNAVTIQMMEESRGNDFRMISLDRARVARGQEQPPPNEYVFENVPKGTYRLNFSGRTIESMTLEHIKVPGDTPVAELKVKGQLRISGTVIDRDTGAPLEHFAVRVRKMQKLGNGPNSSQENNWSQVNNPGGKFSINLVGAGIYRVQASADGYAWSWSDDVRIEQATSDVVVSLSKGGSLSGSVVDGEGKAVEGAKIVPLSMAQSFGASGRKARFENDAGAVESNAAGKFAVQHLSAGTESIKIVHPNFAPIVVSNLLVGEGFDSPVGEIRLPRGAVVDGTVYDVDGHPVPNQVINFQDSSGYNGDESAGRIATANTDAQGRYHIEHIPQQLLYVNLASRSQRAGIIQRTIRPPNGKSLKLDFGGTEALTGRLLVHGQPMANTSIVISSDDPNFGGVLGRFQSDTEGRFVLRGIPSGSYTLFVGRTDPRTMLPVKTLAVVSGTQALGDMDLDLGDVLFTYQSEDPASLTAIRPYSGVSIAMPQRSYGRDLSRVIREAGANNLWRATDLISPGRYQMDSSLGANSIILRTFFERTANSAETTIPIHVPNLTATLDLQFEPVSPELKSLAYVCAVNEGKTVFVWASAELNAKSKLPPGTYHFYTRYFDEPLPEMPTVTLKEGQTTSVRVPAVKLDSYRLDRMIIVMDSGGLLRSGSQVRVFDSTGKEYFSTGDRSTGLAFPLRAGEYIAKIDRGTKSVVEQKFTVAAPSVEQLAGDLLDSAIFIYTDD